MVRILLAKTYYRFKRLFLRMAGYNIGQGTEIERKVQLDKLNPKGLYIGNFSLIASGAIILSHSHVTRGKDGGPKCYETRIGSQTFVGINAIVNPGIIIGDNVIIGDGSVVTKNIPSNTFAAGNPARVIKNIQTKSLGKIV